MERRVRMPRRARSSRARALVARGGTKHNCRNASFHREGCPRDGPSSIGAQAEKTLRNTRSYPYDPYAIGAPDFG